VPEFFISQKNVLSLRGALAPKQSHFVVRGIASLRLAMTDEAGSLKDKEGDSLWIFIIVIFML